MNSSYFKFILINVGRFLGITIINFILYIILAFEIGPSILIYFTACSKDCAIEVFTSMFLSSILIGIPYLYFLIKSIKQSYKFISGSRSK